MSAYTVNPEKYNTISNEAFSVSFTLLRAEHETKKGTLNVYVVLRSNGQTALDAEEGLLLFFVNKALIETYRLRKRRVDRPLFTVSIF